MKFNSRRAAQFAQLGLAFALTATLAFCPVEFLRTSSAGHRAGNDCHSQVGGNHSLHYLRNRPNGRGAGHNREGLWAVARIDLCTLCLSYHHVGAVAIRPTMSRPAAIALNKPLLIVGVDRKLAGLACILSVIVGANGSKIAGLVLFLGLCVLGRRLTRRDPNIFLVINQIRNHKALYDPMKREWFRVAITRGTR